MGVFGPHPLLARLDARVARADLTELATQVAYLSKWFGQLASSVPPPGDLTSPEEADAAWRLVSGSRFFHVGWRDNDLAALRDRLGGYRSVPDLAADADRAAKEIEALAERARHFSQALLDRRAELAA